MGKITCTFGRTHKKENVMGRGKTCLALSKGKEHKTKTGSQSLVWGGRGRGRRGGTVSAEKESGVWIWTFQRWILRCELISSSLLSSSGISSKSRSTSAPLTMPPDLRRPVRLNGLPGKGCG